MISLNGVNSIPAKVTNCTVVFIFDAETSDPPKGEVMFCDLHIHSVYSDGTYTPAEIIAEAKKLGLTVALTDHNTAAGLSEFMAAAEAANVTAVAGTELSTDLRGTELHLLGFFIPPEHYGTVDKLTARYAALKEKSNIDLVKHLNDAGYRIDYADVKKRNATGNVNRAHIASELKDKGYVASVSEAFDTLLYEGGGFYESAEKLDFFEAVRFLRSIHSLPVLAHPLEDLEADELRAVLPEAIDVGLIGIEARHSSYNEEAERICDEIAEEFGLLKSGGSDFHGKAKPDVYLGIGKGGMSVPKEFYREMKKHIDNQSA